MARRTILFAAGGSGGHLFPAIAVAEVLRERQPECGLALVASEREIDRAILARHSFDHHHLAAVSPSLFLRQPWRVIRDNWKAWRDARMLLHKLAPTIVVGCGGFASVPLVVAALRERIPVVLLEQNLIPGRATVWLSRWASSLCLSFAETCSYLPSVVTRRQGMIHITGNPVRRSMIPAGNPMERSQNLLLVLGGSQGARHVNEAVVEWVCSRPAALKGWRLIHQTGSGDHTSVNQRYREVTDHLCANAVEFMDDLSRVTQEATFVIARAGATSLAELAIVGAPTVLIPLPTAARDHQTANANWYCARGAARLVRQQASPSATSRQMAEAATPLILQPPLRETLSRMIRQESRPQAAEDVARVIESLIETGPST